MMSEKYRLSRVSWRRPAVRVQDAVARTAIGRRVQLKEVFTSQLEIVMSAFGERDEEIISNRSSVVKLFDGSWRDLTDGHPPQHDLRRPSPGVIPGSVLGLLTCAKAFRWKNS